MLAPSTLLSFAQNLVSLMANTLPLVPLKDVVVFPYGIVPLSIGRKKSVRATNAALEEHDGNLVVVLQKDPLAENPTQKELFSIGTRVKIVQSIALRGDEIRLLVEGRERAQIVEVSDQDRFLVASYNPLKDSKLEDEESSTRLQRICEKLLEQFVLYSNASKSVHQEVVASLMSIRDVAHMTDLISSYIVHCKAEQKQKVLEEIELEKRALKLLELLQKEIIVLQTDQEIEHKVKSQIEKSQKEYYLKEKITAIQRELEGCGEKSESEQFAEKINSLNLSSEAKAKAQSELKKYKLMSPMSAEASVVRNYLDTLLSMPWGTCSKQESIDLAKSRQILNSAHYGLEKVKERIIEYLAVLQRADKLKGPALFLVGPPGVGKSSLASSIAKATGRKYVKCSLGGLHDEAEIRGHRRTYVGSMPGKIINAIKKSATDDPVILLDEIDKMGSDFRGDPASALLEVLDPEQNFQFVDNYLEVEYDLSKVLFVAAANSLACPSALLDRMEVIRLSGYLDEEKMEIAKKYLIPKQMETHKLKENEFHISDGALLKVVQNYTRESGVRNLEREIGALARKSLVKILENEKEMVRVTISNLKSFLGVEGYQISKADKYPQVGVTAGLAYTEMGGDLLYIEAVLVPGKGEIHSTGKLGPVMKESAEAAFSFFKSKASSFGVDIEKYRDRDVHVHVPEGAIPKDGPSAGIAVFTTIVSVMTGIPVKSTIAMTGEITLRGKVLPIGGLKEKLLGAKRGGIATVIIPKDNEKDLEEVPSSIKDSLHIMKISSAEEAITHAIAGQLPAALPSASQAA